MTVTTTTQGWNISELVQGRLLSRHYVGCTRREALRLFKRCKAGFERGVASVREAERHRYDRMSVDELRTYTNSDR